MSIDDVGPRDALPPPAKLTLDYRGKEWWACYWCENGLMPAGFSGLSEREVARCSRCGKFQVIGASEQIRRAAEEADKADPVAGKREQATSSPPSPPLHTWHDRRAMNRLSAALERQQDRDVFAGLRRKRQTAQLPPELDPATRSAIQCAYDDLMARHGKAPKNKVAAAAGKSRNTVDKYWRFVKQ